MQINVYAPSLSGPGCNFRYELYLPEIHYSLTANFQSDKWIYEVLNYLGPEPEVGGISVYNDNAFVGSQPDSISLESSPGTSDVVLGRRYTDEDNYYTSLQVDELMFFNRNLSASDIKAFYNLYQ